MLGMAVKQLNPVRLPVSQERLATYVREDSRFVGDGYTGPTGNPFGDVSSQTGDRNVMQHNSAAWVEVTYDDKELGASWYKPAQHFELCETADEVIETAAYLADSIIAQFPEIHGHNTLTAWVCDKVAEGFAFRVGIIENVVEEEIERQLGVSLKERSLSEVAKDEHKGIDLKGEAEDKLWNVKFESDNSTKEGIKRVDVCRKGDMLEIEVEL